MAAAVRVLADDQPVGSTIREVFVEVKGDASYPTGGYAIGSAQGLPNLGTPLMADWEIMPGANATQSWAASYDYVNNKVKIARDNGELGNATNLSTLVLRGRLAYKVA
jgi:hypothetical protein